MNIVKSLLVAVVAFTCAASASAAEYAYTLTGPSGGYSASWRLSSPLVPDEFNPGQGFALYRVEGTFPGATAGAAYLDFFSLVNGGGLTISDADGPDLLATFTGEQLYGGTESSPILREGLFALTNVSNGQTQTGYSLQVAAVPEPASWALMMVGFGLVGGAIRGRARRISVRYA